MTFTADGISVEITRKRIKNMHLYVSADDGRVRASVPYRLTDKQVEDFIISKLDWIKKHREKALEKSESIPQYQAGEYVLLFGDPHILRIEKTDKRPRAYAEDGEIFLLLGEKNDTETRRSLLDALYKKELGAVIDAYIQKWEKITHLKHTAHSIRSMKTRWGSCSTKSGRIRFNLELAKKSPELIEYVVLHELSHLREANHGERFKAMLDAYMPNWRARRDTLNGKKNKS